MTFGEELRKKRKEKGMTQDTLAEALNVSRQAVAKWEAGVSFPSTENLLELRELLGIFPQKAPEEERSELEEYALWRLEQDRIAEKRWVVFRQKAKDALLTVVAYTIICLICWVVFYLCGVENCIWGWMQKYPVLLLTGACSLWAVLREKKRLGGVLLVGTIAAIALGNFLGQLEIRRSPIGYNNGWVYYLAILYLFGMMGLIIERKRAKLKVGKVKTFAGILIFVLVVAWTAFISVQHVQYGQGAEAGYLAGYAVGGSDAQAGRPLDSSAPEETPYEFGSARWKGYMMKWTVGYEAGYQDERDGRG